MNPEPSPTPPNSIYDVPLSSSEDIKRYLLQASTRLLARNPFYLISAGLLLWGINRFTSNPTFAGADGSRLGFNFSTLLIYELLMVLTATFLARRAIWYDSLLLVALENLFVLLPFSLVSRAVFVSPELSWTMCEAGLLVAAFKLAVMKWSMPQLNLPRRLVFFGLVILVVNAAAPLLFRHYAEKIEVLKILIHYSWLVMLPVLAALFEFLPRKKYTGTAPAQQHWPKLLLGVWLLVTACHIGGIGYVHTIAWKFAFLAPALWVLTWILARRTSAIANLSSRTRELAFCLPAVVPFLAIEFADNKLFFLLTALNAVAYFIAYLTKKRRAAIPLALASLALMIIGLPEAWGRMCAPDFTRFDALSLAVGGYLFAWTVTSRDPRKGVLGALVIGLGTAYCLSPAEFGSALALQIGLVFLLLHSLRWEDDNYSGAKATRFAACAFWLLHSISWARSDIQIASPSIIQFTCAVLLFYCMLRILLHQWPALIVPSTAGAILAVVACQKLPSFSVDVPGEFWAIAGSFVLFGIGTIAALRKSRWAKQR